MFMRKISISADTAGNILFPADYYDEALHLFAGETLEIICSRLDENTGTEVPFPAEGTYDAFVSRKSDGWLMAYSDCSRIFCDKDGRVHIILDTGNVVLADAAADPYTEFILHLFHYPAGCLCGEEFFRVPVEFAPGSIEFPNLHPLTAESRSMEEFFSALPDRSSPVLETYTGNGWKLNCHDQGRAWRWHTPGGMSPVLQMSGPGALWEFSGLFSERENKTAGRSCCSYYSVDTGGISFKSNDLWSREIKLHGEAGTDSGETCCDTLFAPSLLEKGIFYCDPLRHTLKACAIEPLPMRVIIEYKSGEPFGAVINVKGADGTLFGSLAADIKAGTHRVEIPLSGEGNCQMVLETETDAKNDFIPLDFTFRRIISVYKAGKTPLARGFHAAACLGHAGRCAGGEWVWTGSGTIPAKTGRADSDGFFGGTEEGKRWGIETGIDLRDMESWSISGIYSFEGVHQVPAVLFRAGDPVGGGYGCIAALLIEKSGEDGVLTFRLNANNRIYTLQKDIPAERMSLPNAVCAVFDSIKKRIMLHVQGLESSILDLPEYLRPALPLNIPGTAYPLLEAGYSILDRADKTAAGGRIKTITVSKFVLERENFEFIAKLLE